MKILFGAKVPESQKIYPPKRAIRQCISCGSWLVVERDDCEEGETVLGRKAFYAKCPICGKYIYVCDMYR